MEDGARRKSVKEIPIERHAMIGEEKFDTKQVTIETAEKGAVLKGVSLLCDNPSALWFHLELFSLRHCEVNSQHNIMGSILGDRQPARGRLIDAIFFREGRRNYVKLRYLCRLRGRPRLWGGHEVARPRR